MATWHTRRILVGADMKIVDDKKHFSDCPSDKYKICTCDMCGEEISLVEWQIAKQEGRQKWWHFVAKLSIAGAPEIPLRDSP